MKNRRTLRFVIPFAVSAAMLCLLAYGMRDKASELPQAIAGADWWLIAPAIGLYFVAVWVRSARWGVLLPEHSVRISVLFRALVLGFTVNNLLPLRVGDPARAYLLARWCGIPYGTTIASLIVERVLDGLSLAFLLLVALTLVPSAPTYLVAGGVFAAALFLFAATLLALAAWRASAITAVAGFVASLLPARYGKIIEQLAINFSRSLALVHSPARLVRLIGLSLGAWCIELGVFFVLLVAFRLSESYPLALLVGSAANFATIVPSSPGYAGTFDLALSTVLQSVAGVDSVKATAYDLVVHYAVLYIPVVVLGTLVLWRSHMTFTQITQAPERSPVVAAERDRQAA
jgi:glycosyltransferase 2 family protein